MALGRVAENKQSAPVRRRGFQDELQIFAKAHVEHFVGFVQHRRLQRRYFQGAPFQVIAQPSRRSDDDMGRRAPVRRSCPGSMPPTHETMRAPA